MSTRFILLISLIFAAAYGLAPLFYSNQNQYFVHGFAHAGWGYLHQDWLGDSIDPTPFFSYLVENVVRHLPLESFIVMQFLLLTVYAYGLLRIADSLFGGKHRWLVAVLFVGLHSAAARWLSYRLLGQDYPWYFQAGVAGQYVTGAMFQPSVFGVLLILGVSEFLRGQWGFCATLIAAASTVHPTYLLPGAMLTVGLMVAAARTGRPFGGLRLGLLTLALVLPVALHTWESFAPSSAETFREAQRILVHVRIPHHAKVDRWLDPVAGVQILWVISATLICRGGPLFWILAIPLSLSAILTGVQVATASDSLALLFPWRVSAILVPIATAVILGRIARAEIAPRVAVVVLLLLGCAGIAISVGRWAFHLPPEEEGLLTKVRSMVKPGDIFAIPVRIPDPAKTPRGSSSSDFKPLAEKRDNVSVIPIDLQRFRLATGAPIFVDFKAIPYKDFEVIEWLDNLKTVDQGYQQLRNGQYDEALRSFQKQTISHFVWPRWRELNDRRLDLLYEDDSYQLFAVLPIW